MEQSKPGINDGKGSIIIGAIDDETKLPLRMEDVDDFDDDPPTPRPIEISKKQVVINTAGRTVLVPPKKDEPILPVPTPVVAVVADDLKVTDFNEEDSKDNETFPTPVPIIPSVVNKDANESKDNKESTANVDTAVIISPNNDDTTSNTNPAVDTNVTNHEPNPPAGDDVVPMMNQPLPRGFLSLRWGSTKPAASISSSLKPEERNIEQPAPRAGTKWKPPSLEKANEYRLQTMYREGTAPLWSTDLVEASDLSRGVVLHFFFLRSVIICMCVMTLLSFPILIFCYYGSRIPLALQDPIGLYRFTLGNLGYDPTRLNLLDWLPSLYHNLN